MKLFRINNLIEIHHQGEVYRADGVSWDDFVNRKNLYAKILEDLPSFIKLEQSSSEKLQCPVGSQEIWAAGVTYFRSKTARSEESSNSGGSVFYDRVYEAARPELFFKCNPHRLSDPGAKLRIRSDSTWNVPEPELTLFVTTHKTIEGYTLGNDMSSRSIEGENPLYLPQAKTYDGCASIGPCLYVVENPDVSKWTINLRIKRKNQEIFTESVSVAQIKRSLTELVDYLFKESSFPKGCFLMTGTGIVPPDDFTLMSGDEVEIAMEPVGVLKNGIE
ncbi:MAG: fumarylacetoacetate hydrolase family protein [Cyclobacteriaceae bacterium]|nr:fumarylacetoacetate hydrolase family protein [Cyclobacteriaceae bacterium]